VAAPAGAARLRWALSAVAVGLSLLGAAFAVQLLEELLAPPGVAGHHDLLAFWAAGRLILEGRPEALYDATALTALQRTVIEAPVGVNGYMPFINPPIAAVLFAPLASLPEPAARVLWAGLNAVLAAGTGFWLGRGLPMGQRLAATFLVATSFPMVHALAEGQWSIVLLAAGLVALAAAQRGAWLIVGIALAPFWLKPQFILGPLVALTIGRQWRALIGALAVGGAAAAAGLPFSGFSSYVTYVSYLRDVVVSHFTGAGIAQAAIWQGDLASTEGLNGLLVGWLGQGAVGMVNLLWAGLVVGLAGFYLLAIRRVRPELRTPTGRALLAAGIAVVLLVNPNQFVQDCVLVFLALDALAPLSERWRFGAVVAAVALADLTFLDQRVAGLHAFPLVLAAAVAYACWRAMRREPRSPAAMARDGGA
jgi:hypothetical protein